MFFKVYQIGYMQMKNLIIGLQVPRKGIIGTMVALLAIFQGVFKIIITQSKGLAGIGKLNYTKGTYGRDVQQQQARHYSDAII